MESAELAEAELGPVEKKDWRVLHKKNKKKKNKKKRHKKSKKKKKEHVTVSWEMI